MANALDYAENNAALAQQRLTIAQQRLRFAPMSRAVQLKVLSSYLCTSQSPANTQQQNGQSE